MSPFVISIFNSIAFVIYCYLVSYIILQKKQSDIKKIILAILTFLIMYYCILCLLGSIYSVFFSGLCAFLFIKIMFEENIFMSLFISLILHTIKMTFKILIIMFLDDNQLLINTYKTLDLDAFYINVVSMVLGLVLIIILMKPLKNLIKYISGLKNRQIILLIIIYVSFILIIVFQPPKNIFCLQTITDFFMIFTVTGMGIFNISSETKMEDLTNHYREIFECSKANGELLSNYKMQVHENKNKLLMISGMLDGPKKDVKKYIDSVLKEINENKINSNYWLTELRYIPLPGVKNFINYKLTKLKSLGAEIEIFVSSEIQNVDASSLSNNEYNQLSTILGVVLDNMIESIKETKEKLISINIYLEDNEIHSEFVNTFSGKIDLNRLTEIGYTTKGEQHGVGLPLVAKIIKMNNRFKCEPKIIDIFFVQHLTIKLYDKKNLQKISKN